MNRSSFLPLLSNQPKEQEGVLQSRITNLRQDWSLLPENHHLGAVKWKATLNALSILLDRLAEAGRLFR